MGIYEKLGVKRVINALGNATVLGGSILSKDVVDAMLEANSCFVEMWELQERTGAIVAEICGAEAGWITPGAHAALVLSAAACIAGKDEEKIRRLPDTRGMKNQIILQACQRYFFDRAMETAGGKLVTVGSEEGCTAEEIESAINEKTAAILYNVYKPEGAVPESEVIAIGKRHGVPVIVDAAYDVYPITLFRKHVSMGADLVCYGGKYFGAPNSTGFVVGRKDLIESIALQSFIGYHWKRSGSIGRGYKLDRQEVIGLVVALQNWIKMDHEKRIEENHRKVRYLKDRLSKIPEVKVEEMPDRPAFIGLRVTLKDRTPEETQELYDRFIYGGDPKIAMNVEENTLIINVITLKEGEEEVVADRLEEALSRHVRRE